MCKTPVHKYVSYKGTPLYPPNPNKQRSTVAEVSGRAFDMAINMSTGEEIVFSDVSETAKRTDLFEECYSESHPGWQDLRGKKEDVGGPFWLYRTKIEHFGSDSGAFTFLPWIDPWWRMQGCTGRKLPISLDKLEFPPALASSEEELTELGATAIARAAPGAAPVDLATALGELGKDGIPKLPGSTWKERTSTAKKAGDEYLNAQFGWAPLVSDVLSVADLVTRFDDIVSQLERDAGKRVRRRLTLEDGWSDIQTENLGFSNTHFGPIGSGIIDNFFPGGDVTLTTRSYRKVWFAGSFTYYLPPDYYSRNAVKRAAARANAIGGIELNPTILWNLAPWSWAADWVSNAGDVISNTHRFLSEGLVMHHGYLMEHTIHERTYSRREIEDKAGSVRLITETKSRMKANPFGFGMKWPDLNGFQMSILGALGLSRGG